MKRLVFCFDGTWNRLDATHPTNVVLTAESVLPHVGGVSQVVYYDEGVGTGRGERLFGGAFGLGLTKNLADAYRFLIFNYTPGDHIFVFGFSRGAYTARSFVGLLLTCGILERRSAAYVSKVIDAYRERPLSSDSLTFVRERLQGLFSPSVCVSDIDRQWRCENQSTSEGDKPVLQIRYLGVWDTVGALGVPKTFWLAGLINKKYKFHNTELDPRIESARHAVAIDERRTSFEPTLWTNLDDLNAHRGNTSSEAAAPYQQVWFPGTHGSVGGGGPKRGLSDQALDWVWDGARLAGLRLDTSPSSRIYELCPAGGELLDNRGSPSGIVGKTLQKIGKRSLLKEADRMPGPSVLHEVSVTAQRRWLESGAYRPATLSLVKDLIEDVRSQVDGADLTSRDSLAFSVYEVQRGDSLSKIASRLLGDADLWVEIVRCNTDKIIDPDRIYVGQILRIPLRGETETKFP